MEPRDWLLLLLEEDLDPIRIQKGMFLFAEESGARENELYEFQPYNWGPCSFRIYDDLDGLHNAGLIERRPVPGKSWYRYQVTDAGRSLARSLPGGNTRAADCLDQIKASIKGASFNDLLRSVYEKYPQYATKSQFQA